MTKFAVLFLLIVILVGVLYGCGLISPPAGSPTSEPPAAEMLPVLPGYNTFEGQLLTDYISTLSEGAAVLAGQPELAVTIAAVDRVIGCYQTIGAVRARVYSQADDPLSAGTVAIADRNILLDPTNLFSCILPSAPEGLLPADGIEPCSASYTISREGNEFYVLYAATTSEVCQAFCSALEECTAH